MKLVADTNILFSFFRKDSLVRGLIVTKPDIELFSPKFVLDELDRYAKTVMSKACISRDEYELFKQVLEGYIEFVPVKDFKEFLHEAGKISPDPEDVEFFALALKYNAAIWSYDKKLKCQDHVKVLTTKEVMDTLRSLFPEERR